MASQSSLKSALRFTGSVKNDVCDSEVNITIDGGREGERGVVGRGGGGDLYHDSSLIARLHLSWSKMSQNVLQMELAMMLLSLRHQGVSVNPHSGPRLAGRQSHL